MDGLYLLQATCCGHHLFGPRQGRKLHPDHAIVQRQIQHLALFVVKLAKDVADRTLATQRLHFIRRDVTGAHDRRGGRKLTDADELEGSVERHIEQVGDGRFRRKVACNLRISDDKRRRHKMNAATPVGRAHTVHIGSDAAGQADETDIAFVGEMAKPLDGVADGSAPAHREEVAMLQALHEELGCCLAKTIAGSWSGNCGTT